MNARIQHVSIPRPPGTENEARAFYGELLGFHQVKAPDTLSPDLIWYELGETELHLLVEEGTDQSSGRHFCIAVDNVQALRQRLEEANYPLQETTPIPGRPRFFVQDPFGNRIEFTTIEWNYREKS